MSDYLVFILAFINPSKNFEALICEYDFETLSVSISKKELINGFKKLHKIKCDKVHELITIAITTQRNVQVFHDNEFDSIPKYLKQFKKGDVLELTLIFNKPFLQRRNKIITII